MTGASVAKLPSRLPDCSSPTSRSVMSSPSPTREEILQHGDDPRALDRVPEQPPGRARGDDDRVGAALAQQVGVLLLAHRGDDPRARVELARGERDQHRAVVAVGRDDDRGGVAHARRLEHGRRARVADHAGVAASASASSIASRVLVDHDDRAGLLPVREQGLDRGAALDAVAADDGVVAARSASSCARGMRCGSARPAPRAWSTTRMTRNSTPAGITTSDVDQPRAVADRRDVAVAGRGHADRAEVERVERVDLAAAAVAEPVPVQVGDHRDDQHEPGRDAERGAAGPRAARGRSRGGGHRARSAGTRWIVASGAVRRVPPCCRRPPEPPARPRRQEPHAGSAGPTGRAQGARPLSAHAHGQRPAGAARGPRRQARAPAVLEQLPRARRPPAGARGGGRRRDALGRRRRRLAARARAT